MYHTGRKEEDGCSQKEVNVCDHDLLSNAVVKSNNARGASSGAEGSSVQQSQEWSNPGCDLLSSAGINNSDASSALRDNKDDQVGCSQEKFEVNNTGLS